MLQVLHVIFKPLLTLFCLKGIHFFLSAYQPPPPPPPLALRYVRKPISHNEYIVGDQNNVNPFTVNVFSFFFFT